MDRPTGEVGTPRIPQRITIEGGRPRMTSESLSPLFIEFDGRQLSVTTDVPEARQYLEDAFRHMLAIEVTESAGALSFVRSSDGFVLSSAERFEYRAVPIGQVLPLVKDEVRLHFMRSRPDLLWLHAGAVAFSGRAVMLAAPSGQGKSSLTTRLSALGWEFLSDDIAPVRMDVDRVLPFPQTPIRRIHPGSEIDAGEIWTLRREEVAIDNDLVAAREVPLCAVVFVNYIAGSPPIIAKLLPGSGAMEVLRNLTNFVDHRASAVMRAAEIARRLPLFRLEYGLPDDGAAAINNLVLSQFC